jgi:hypothetical protein
MGIQDRDYMRRDYVPRRAREMELPSDTRSTPYWPFIVVGGALIFGGILLVISLNPVKATSSTQRKEKARNQTQDARSFKPLDINVATYEQIRSVPYMSEATAKSIIQLRPFKEWEDIDAVYGVGPKRLESLREYFIITSSKSTAPNQLEQSNKK